MASTKLPPTAAVVVIIGLNREDARGQSTHQTVRRCVIMLFCVLDGVVMCWCPVADWSSVGAFHVLSSDHPCDNYRPVNCV